MILSYSKVLTLSDSLISPVISVKCWIKRAFSQKPTFKLYHKTDIYYLFTIFSYIKSCIITGKKRIIEGKSLRKEEYHGG